MIPTKTKFIYIHDQLVEVKVYEPQVTPSLKSQLLFENSVLAQDSCKTTDKTFNQLKGRLYDLLTRKKNNQTK